MNVNWIGPTIMVYGSEEQKAFHLPRISAGDVFWCQGFSEPEAGSDLVCAAHARRCAMATTTSSTARRSGPRYVNHADFCFLLVRTDPPRSATTGISVLLVPMDTPGIEVREIPSVVGEHYFLEVFFSDARVPVSCRLGPEGEGWDVVAYALALRTRRRGALRARRRRLDVLAERARARGLLADATVAREARARRAPSAKPRACSPIA